MTLPLPVGRQREVVYLPASGHQAVLGTAGSGKTTMALLRAIYLSDPQLPGNGATLIITFNKTLAGYLRFIGGIEAQRITVENYHKFARGYLASQGVMTASSIVGSHQRRTFIEDAVADVRTKVPHPTLFDRPTDFFIEEVRWLASHGITGESDYVAASRTGRAEARLERNQRGAMWAIYQSYLANLAESGKSYDLDNLATHVAAAFDRDQSHRRYRHVIIDEGQDLSPEMLRSLSKAIPKGGSLTFFGDVAQQIYGHRMSWRSAGLQVAKAWQFEQNYRNTRQIAEFGLAVSKMPYYSGAADMVTPIAPTADGPKPTLVEFQDKEKELAFAIDQAKKASETRQVAILLRTVAQARTVRDALPSSSVWLKGEAASWPNNPTLYFGTYHSAKGLEFDTVIMPFLSSDLLPEPNSVATVGADDAAANDGRLLYVGVTRAKTALIMTYTGTPTTLLPTERNLTTRLTR